jgi:hypothetical protein
MVVSMVGMSSSLHQLLYFFSTGLDLPQVHFQASDLLLSVFQVVLEVILSPVKLCNIQRVLRPSPQQYKSMMKKDARMLVSVDGVFGAPNMFVTLWFGFDYETNPPLGTLMT